MNRNEKTDLVNNLHDTFDNAASVVIVHCIGLTVEESTNLRTKMRNENCNFKVTKNRIARIALKDTKYQHMDSMCKGPIGGGLEDKALSKIDVEALAKLPSLNDLRGKLVGLLQAPASKILRLSVEPASQVLRTISQKSKQ